MSELRKAAGAVAKTSAAIINSADGLMAAAVGDMPPPRGGAAARRQNDRVRHDEVERAEAERRANQEEREALLQARDEELGRGW